MKQQHYINGAWTDSAGGEFVSLNPATGETLWRGREATASEVGAAVQAAQGAFAAWRELEMAEREEFVGRFVGGIEEDAVGLARAIHEETGKPLWETKTEVAGMIAKAEVSLRAYGERTGTADSGGGGLSSQLTHRPIGVFAVLGPYNFPGHLPNGHIIPALLAGNTVVFKPSEMTPRVGELMVAHWAAAGLPPGVLNLVQGGGDTGKALVAADIDGLLFTGSSRTGHAIHKAFAGQPQKMLALEMGGNNPLVVDTVADTDGAVYNIVQSAFISSGQRCTCARRLLLVRNAANEKLLQRLQTVTEAIKVGSGDDCFMGPLISNQAADMVMAFNQSLLDKGAISLVPLRRPDSKLPFVHPGIVDVTEMADKGKVGDEECFGPLLQLRWVDDLDAAIAAANDTRYGLSAGLLSDDQAPWQRFAAGIRAGIVNFNRPTTGAGGAAPFGGVGASGNYRPGAFYAADYCAYPMASVLSDKASVPAEPSPGIPL